MRARLDRLAAAAQGRHQVVADLARDVRFSYVDEPLLDKVTLDESAIVDSHLDALRAEPDRDARRDHIDRLVASPQPLREHSAATLAVHKRRAIPQLLLEVYAPPVLPDPRSA